MQAARLRSFGSGALVLFSGDAFHPSLLSTVTQARERCLAGRCTCCRHSQPPRMHGLYKLLISSSIPGGHSQPPTRPLRLLQGKQMVEVLNACNVKAACVGVSRPAPVAIAAVWQEDQCCLRLLQRLCCLQCWCVLVAGIGMSAPM